MDVVALKNTADRDWGDVGLVAPPLRNRSTAGSFAPNVVVWKIPANADCTPTAVHAAAAAKPCFCRAYAEPQAIALNRLSHEKARQRGCAGGLLMVGVARIELATPAMSTQCSTTELHAHEEGASSRGFGATQAGAGRFSKLTRYRPPCALSVSNIRSTSSTRSRR